MTLGRALLELGQLEPAQHELQRVLASGPGNLPALRGLAEVLHRRGLRSQALVHYQRALDLRATIPSWRR